MTQPLSAEVRLLVEEKFQKARDEMRHEVASTRNLVVAVFSALSLILGVLGYFGFDFILKEQMKSYGEAEINKQIMNIRDQSTKMDVLYAESLRSIADKTQEIDSLTRSLNQKISVLDNQNSRSEAKLSHLVQSQISVYEEKNLELNKKLKLVQEQIVDQFNVAGVKRLILIRCDTAAYGNCGKIPSSCILPPFEYRFWIICIERP